MQESSIWEAEGAERKELICSALSGGTTEINLLSVSSPHACQSSHYRGWVYTCNCRADVKIGLGTKPSRANETILYGTVSAKIAPR